MRLRIAFCVVVAALALLPGPAYAQVDQLKSDRCSTVDDDTGPPTGSTSTTSTTTPGDKDAENGVCGDLLDDIAPGDNPGKYPTANYDIGYDEGGNCICTSRRVTGLVTQWLFTANAWVVRIGLGIVGWVLDFHIVRLLLAPAQNIGNAFQARIVDPTGAGVFFLFVCALWGGFMAFAGKLGRGASEFGTSLVILALAAGVWSDPGGSLSRGLDFTADLGSEIAAVGSGAQSTTGSTGESVVGDAMAASIHRAFVENPHQLLSWGRTIPEGDKCYGVYDRAVQTGPWGTSSKPRKAMKEVGCVAEDKFNRNPSLGRLGAAWLVLIASILFIFVLLRAAWEVIKAQIEVLVSIIIWPFALLSGTLPGAGRMAFWHWISATLHALGRVLAVMMLMAVTLTGVSAILEATTSEKLVPQMLLVIVVVGVGLVKLKSVVEGAKRTATEFTKSMSRRAPARTSGWLTPAAAGMTGAALVGRAQHALQTHQTNSRGRELVSQGRDRLELERQTAGSMDFGSGDTVQNVLFVFNGGSQRQNDRYQPRYQPPRPRRPAELPNGGPVQQPPRREPPALSPARPPIPVPAGAVRDTT